MRHTVTVTISGPQTTTVTVRTAEKKFSVGGVLFDFTMAPTPAPVAVPEPVATPAPVPAVAGRNWTLPVIPRFGVVVRFERYGDRKIQAIKAAREAGRQNGVYPDLRVTKEVIEGFTWFRLFPENATEFERLCRSGNLIPTFL